MSHKLHTLPPFRFSVRIYYEDTDAAGIVYHANYLKYAERARTEWLRSLGISLAGYAAEQKAQFVLRKANLEIYAPARLEDTIEIWTMVKELRGASLLLQQSLYCNQKAIAEIEVEVVWVSLSLKARRIPLAIRDKIIMRGK